MVLKQIYRGLVLGIGLGVLTSGCTMYYNAHLYGREGKTTVNVHVNGTYKTPKENGRYNPPSDLSGLSTWSIR